MRDGCRIAGVDEAGRGPLAGPVVAAAVVLPRDHGLRLADSKCLTARQRERLAPAIRDCALAWSVALATREEIEAMNIHRATLLAMARALGTLAPAPEAILVDGCFVPEVALPCTAVIGGDASIPAISAASILAKVARDEMMIELDRRYPVYGFARHKGYATALHLAALRRYGPCPEHRRTYAPVRALLAEA